MKEKTNSGLNIIMHVYLLLSYIYLTYDYYHYCYHYHCCCHYYYHYYYDMLRYIIVIIIILLLIFLKAPSSFCQCLICPEKTSPSPGRPWGCFSSCFGFHLVPVHKCFQLHHLPGSVGVGTWWVQIQALRIFIFLGRYQEYNRCCLCRDVLGGGVVEFILLGSFLGGKKTLGIKSLKPQGVVTLPKIYFSR